MNAVAIAKLNRRYQGLPAKLLLCSIPDSLSMAAFPNSNGVGKRFCNTVSSHSNWGNYDRGSLLQLCGVMDQLKQIPQSFTTIFKLAQSMITLRVGKNSYDNV